MKYSLNVNQKNKSYLQECDEIRIAYNENFDELKLINEFPDKNFLVEIPYFCEDIDWKRLSNFNKMCQNRLIIAISDIDDIDLCKENGLKFFYGFPVTTFEEVNRLKDLGVCYVKLGAPLFFELPEVKKIGVPIRATANKSTWNDLIPTGIYGTWIRPEDIEIYDEYIDIVDFFSNSSEQEGALYRIYAKEKLWVGNLNQIVFDLNYSAENGLLNSDITKKRIDCGQRCQKNGACQLCKRSMDLANRERIQQYKEAIDRT